VHILIFQMASQIYLQKFCTYSLFLHTSYMPSPGHVNPGLTLRYINVQTELVQEYAYTYKISNFTSIRILTHLSVLEYPVHSVFDYSMKLI
jgi:hypothetical protein